MELGLIVYWSSFYSALLGWYSRTRERINIDKKSDYIDYLTTRVLLAHIIASYILIFLFYILSILKDNVWIISFLALSVIATIEYYWVRTGDLRSKVAESLTVKFIVLIVGVGIYSYCSSMSSTYIEQLTKVSPIIFSSFETLLTFTVGAVVWIFIIQLSIVSLSFIYLLKLLTNKDNKFIENILVIFTSYIAAILFLSMATTWIMGNAIPYMLNKYFVSQMYHSNEDLDGNKICNNRMKNENIVLLPSGDISIATKKNGDNSEWLFTIDVCEKN